jgi:hypothetical protein
LSVSYKRLPGLGLSPLPTMLKSALLLFLFVGTSLCKPLHKRWDDLKVKHAWVDGIPKGWEVVGPAPSEERLAVRIGLKQDGIDDLISHLYAVSDPNHDRYGSYSVWLDRSTQSFFASDTASTSPKHKSTLSPLLTQIRPVSWRTGFRIMTSFIPPNAK